MVKKILHSSPVVGMLVRQHKLCRRHYRAWLIAVHSVHLVGPFPALTNKPEAEASNARAGAANRHLGASLKYGGLGSMGCLHHAIAAHRIVIVLAAVYQHDDVTPVPRF